LVGNPNTGKTSLFNALTGFRRHVANYPGVTVDVARGPIRGARVPLELLDLPGTYSLAAASPDEMILCDALCGRAAARPAAVLAIIDASNPVRNLYLLSQVLEIGLPVVVALNMVDVARARGIEVDAVRLAKRLGVPVVPVIASAPETVAPLVPVLEAAVGGAAPATRVDLPSELRAEADRLAATSGLRICPAEALRILATPDGHAERWFVARGGDAQPFRAARLRQPARGWIRRRAKCGHGTRGSSVR
jgi:ferrous iron transport protein B